MLYTVAKHEPDCQHLLQEC